MQTAGGRARRTLHRNRHFAKWKRRRRLRLAPFALRSAETRRLLSRAAVAPQRRASATHAAIVAVRDALDQRRIAARTLGGELHLDTAVPQGLERRGDLHAATLALDDASTAILRGDRQAFVRHRPRCRRPGTIEALLQRGLRTVGNGFVYDATAQRQSRNEHNEPKFRFHR